LKTLNIKVESAAPEFAKLQPAKKQVSELGLTNKYNTYSILNELRWSLGPDAVPLGSIVPLTNPTQTPAARDVPRHPEKATRAVTYR